MFTLILDFSGGTYVGQAHGSLEEALSAWLSTLEVDGLSGNYLSSLRDSLIADKPTPIDGLKNVWCSTGLVDNNLAIVHIIDTCTD